MSGKEQRAALTERMRDFVYKHLYMLKHQEEMVDLLLTLVLSEVALASPSPASEQAGGTVGLDRGEGATRRDWETDGPAWEKRAKEAEAKLAANEQAGQGDSERAKRWLKEEGPANTEGFPTNENEISLAAEFAQVRQAALGSRRDEK